MPIGKVMCTCSYPEMPKEETIMAGLPSREQLKHIIIAGVIRGLYLSNAHKLFVPRYSGIGGILMFHRVLPESSPVPFAPNSFFEIETSFFELLIQTVLSQGYEIVPMAEVKRRLQKGVDQPRFINLSFDDGYRDNYTHAFPICKKYGVPMIINLTTGYIDRTAQMWWLGLERLMRVEAAVNFEYKNKKYCFPTRDLRGKNAAFSAISKLFKVGSATDKLELSRLLGNQYEVDFSVESDRACLSWDMIREMQASGIVEFGAHTVSHPALSRLQADDAKDEMLVSKQRLGEQLNSQIDHFAYPFGGASEAAFRETEIAANIGFATAVTTRHGMLHLEHRKHMLALPRLSVNGHHQSLETVEVYLSGASAALAGRLRTIVTL